jgi:hypothetical protein
VSFDDFNTRGLPEDEEAAVGGCWSNHGEAGDLVVTARPETLSWLLQHMLLPYPLFFVGDARWGIAHLRMPCHDEPMGLSPEQEIALVRAGLPEGALHPFELDALHEACRLGAYGYTPEEDWGR